MLNTVKKKILQVIMLDSLLAILDLVDINCKINTANKSELDVRLEPTRSRLNLVLYRLRCSDTSDS